MTSNTQPSLATRTWRARLIGDSPDLEALKSLFHSEQCSVEHAGDGFYLLSSLFVSDSAEDVFTDPSTLVDLMNGAARVWVSGYRPVKVGSLHADKPPMHYFSFGGIIRPRGVLTRQVIRAGGGVEKVEDALDGTPLVLTALADPLVADALRLLGQQEHKSWPNLYTLFELVEGDAGRRPLDEKWGEAKLTRFCRTVNNWDVLRDKGRHGPRGWEPPDQPMTYEEALSLVEEIAIWWLRTKS